MGTSFSRLPRAALVQIAVAPILAVLPATGAVAATSASTSADIRIVGGNASSSIVCGNAAEAHDEARRRSVAIQRNDCTALSNGGSVVLENVDIYVSAGASAPAGNAAALASLASAASEPAANPPKPDKADAKCTNDSLVLAQPAAAMQRNKCRATGQGGKLVLKNVTVVSPTAGRGTQARRIDAVTASPGAGAGGGAVATCQNINPDLQHQRDDCTTSGEGAWWRLAGADVVVHNPDGSTSTRLGITVEVRGGTADAVTYCFNVVDAAGRVSQRNSCTAQANGGDATLRNVTVHTTP